MLAITVSGMARCSPVSKAMLTAAAAPWIWARTRSPTVKRRFANHKPMPLAIVATGWRQDRRRADRKPHGIDPIEKGLTLEVVAARQRRRRRRTEDCPQLNPVSRPDRRLITAQPDANALRRRLPLQSGDAWLIQSYPLAVRESLDVRYGASHKGRPDPLGQHSRLDQRRLDLGRSEPGRQSQCCGHDRPHGQNAVAHSKQNPEARDADHERRSGSDPCRRLLIEREVDRDPHTDPNRQPEDPTLLFVHQQRGDAGGQSRSNRSSRKAWVAHEGRRRHAPPAGPVVDRDDNRQPPPWTSEGERVMPPIEA